MNQRVTLSEADLQAMLDQAAERGADKVLERLGCPIHDPAKAIQWFADVQQGVGTVSGVRAWIAALPARVASGILWAIVGLAVVGALVVATKTGVLAPPKADGS